MSAFAKLSAGFLLIMGLSLAGPAPGQSLPGEEPGSAATVSAIESIDQSGRRRTFTELKGKQGLIVAFGRSADWCPICQARLIELNKAEPDFAKEGFNLAAVTGDKPDALARFAGRRSISFPLLADPELEIAQNFGVIEAEGPHAHDNGDRPALLIIDADGVIRGALKEADLKDRGIVEAIMAVMHPEDGVEKLP